MSYCLRACLCSYQFYRACHSLCITYMLGQLVPCIHHILRNPDSYMLASFMTCKLSNDCSSDNGFVNARCVPNDQSIVLNNFPSKEEDKGGTVSLMTASIAYALYLVTITSFTKANVIMVSPNAVAHLKIYASSYARNTPILGHST